MSRFDDIDLEPLLNAPAWLDAHECFQEGQEKKRPFEDLYEVVPLWLYARTCLEEESAGDERDSESQSGVNRLPRNILARIFQELRDSSYQLSSSSKVATRGVHPYSWLFVTLVCRHWRNTAYSHPLLWTYVDLAYDREVLRSLLILSDTESLYVHADTSMYDVSGILDIGKYSIKLDLIMDEQARMKELELVLTSTKYVKLVPWKQFAACAAPRLTKLTLKGVVKNIKPGKRTLPAFLEANLPRLRELVLDGLYPRWDGTCLSALSRLEIHNVYAGDYSPGDFVRCLSRCRELQLLKIDACNIASHIEPR